jgi:protein-L-isoaspartate(D-aspartate) O-methyltransferase
LQEQLKPGGILVVPVGAGDYQILTKVIRTENGYSVSEHGACAFVPLISK